MLLSLYISVARGKISMHFLYSVLGNVFFIPFENHGP